MTLAAAAAAAAVLAVASSGCVWSKHVVNEEIRSYDLSTVVVGETTNLEIVETWGAPAPVSFLAVLNPLEARFFRRASGPYRYVSQETRCTSFLGRVPLVWSRPCPSRQSFPSYGATSSRAT